jgi:signal transduction histidine kinase
MRYVSHKNELGATLQTNPIFLAVVCLCLALIDFSSAAAETVRGLYVGGDFYTPGMMIPEAARASGFTRLFLSYLHIDGDGNIAFNDTPIVKDGRYIGDTTWGAKLAALKTQPSSVARIELVIDGDDGGSFASIKNLAATNGTGSGSRLYQDFLALRNATGADAIQFAGEQVRDVPSTVALGNLIATLGMNVTLCPCTALDFWTKVKSQLGGKVDAVYLQCYKDGSGNDPAAWIKAFGGFKVCPGLSGNTDNFVSAMTKMRAWRQTLGITGGFMWLNGQMPAVNAANWASALIYGLNPIANLRIVNQRSGKSLDLIDGKTINRSSISQLNGDGENNWRWMLVPVENDTHFKIVSWVSGQCVSIAEDSSLVGAQIWSWDYNNDPSQQFDLVDVGNGWFKIKNVRSGLMLEVPGDGTADFIPIQQNVDSDSPGQRWKFVPCQDIELAAEDFNYEVGALDGQNGGTGWDGGWSDGSGAATKVVAGNLAETAHAPPTFQAKAAGNSAFVPSGGRVTRRLDCLVSGPFGINGYLGTKGLIEPADSVLYLGFLQQSSKREKSFEVQFGEGTNRVAGIGNNSTANNISFDIPNHSLTLVGPADTNVNFYVIRIDFKQGNDDVLVFRNPTSTNEPATPTVALTNIGRVSFDGVSLAAADGNTMKFDRLRIANSWQYALGARPQIFPQSSDGIDADDIFRRVRITAQVLGGVEGNYYLIDGSTGVHLTLNQPMKLEAGDIVDATGLVLHARPFVDLIEATANKTGHVSLPKPVSLNVLDSNSRMPWVWIEGVLTNTTTSGTERLLEMQAGVKTIIGRLNLKNQSHASWPLGSRLKLTGLYVRHNSPQPGLENENYYEIMLNSPAAVELIERPPWWTLRRVMVFIEGLLAVLAMALLWITLLRRQMAIQTLRLKNEIAQRELADRAHVIEQERSRISQDLHDDLGSKLTQISMLAWLPREKMTSDLAGERLRLIAEKSRQMTSALDEVVWMMNPKSESVSSFIAYLAAYAEEFLAKSDVTLRVEAPLSCPERVLSSEARNNLFFAVKEAVNNAVRHGKPTRIFLKFAVSADNLAISISDNGCGYDPQTSPQGMGIVNIRDRMRKIRGLCQIDSFFQIGTTITIQVLLN